MGAMLLTEAFLRKSTIPIRGLVDFPPSNNGSGCLTTYNGKHLFLTVHHLLRLKVGWAVEIDYSASRKQTRTYPLESTQKMKPLHSCGSKFCYYDFACEIVPEDFRPMALTFDIPNEALLSSEPRLEVNLSFEEPSKTETYGFVGNSDYIGVGNALYANNYVVEKTLRFRERSGHFYSFDLGHNHPGHDYYKSCSGAPIISSNGETIALVTGGNQRTNLIHGISLASIKSLLDAI